MSELEEVEAAAVKIAGDTLKLLYEKLQGLQEKMTRLEHQQQALAAAVRELKLFVSDQFIAYDDQIKRLRVRVEELETADPF